MNIQTKESMYMIGALLLLVALSFFTGYDLRPEPYKVVEATQIDCMIYTVGLEDRDGYYFSLTQDLIKFSAMGIDVDEILMYGEL